jgi:hypothetical protein
MEPVVLRQVHSRVSFKNYKENFSVSTCIEGVEVRTGSVIAIPSKVVD